MIDEGWLAAAVGRTESDDTGSESVEEMWELLRRCAPGFQKLKDLASLEIAVPRRGLRRDESASFLRAVELGFAEVDDAGYVTLPTVRPKKPVGRYALFSRNGDGMAVNLEYLVQIGATAELVLDHGWDASDIGFERGEFDAFAYESSGTVAVAMEAKARANGPDSLEKLVRSWMTFAADPTSDLANNAGRKWHQVGELCAARPVLIWLVADGARWALCARRDGETIALSPGPAPDRSVVLSEVSMAGCERARRELVDSGRMELRRSS